MAPARPQPHSPPEVRMHTVRILWAALTLSTLILAGVYYYLLTNGAIRVRRPPEPTLLYALSAVATVVGLVSLVFPRAVYKRAAAMVLDKTKDRSRAALLRALLPPFMPTFVLSMALSEAVSLFGLTLGMVGFSATQVAPFFAVGTILAVIRFPTEATVLAPVEDAVR